MLLQPEEMQVARYFVGWVPTPCKGHGFKEEPPISEMVTALRGQECDYSICALKV